MEDILLNTMFELPGMDGVQEVVVKDEAVNNAVPPMIVYAEKKKDAVKA
jgi:ATP-dependent Clp protease ATP-binding subunit ClpX